MGHTLTTSSGLELQRTLFRNPNRRELVTAISNTVNGAQVFIPAVLNYNHDLLNRVTKRNNDTFNYNNRSELTKATLSPDVYDYTYDAIGNKQQTKFNNTPTTRTSNALNQYTQIGSVPLSYDLDGNLLSNGIFTYGYDAENRLTTVSSNNILLVTNVYDPFSRRIQKITPTATHSYFYDSWNLIFETIDYNNGAFDKIDYVWGKDQSGTFQGAGGVGGLLAMSINGVYYYPFFDHNGNITDYVNASGTIVAHYEYDAFGNTIALSGSMASVFRFRFSMKYYDSETGLYYYGYRFYNPVFGRWINRDPIGEDGGINLYTFTKNSPINRFDKLGLKDFGIGVGVGFMVTSTAQGKPQYSFALIGSAKQSACDNIKFKADLGIRILGRGIMGMSRYSSGTNYEIFGTISGVVGSGRGRDTPFYFNGTQWGSMLGDTYASSASLGQTFYYNSALAENVRMGVIRLQSSGVFLNYNNDQKNWKSLGFGDGGDRGWTGGGAIGFSIGGEQFGMIGFDDFTGRAMGTPSLFNRNNPNAQTPDSRNLNQAQWFVGVSGSSGNNLGVSFDAPYWLNVQHWIHSTISLDAGNFEYPQDNNPSVIEYRFRSSGFLKAGGR